MVEKPMPTYPTYPTYPVIQPTPMPAPYPPAAYPYPSVEVARKRPIPYKITRRPRVGSYRLTTKFEGGIVIESVPLN